MTIQAQAGSVQVASARGGAQLLAVFVFLVALFVGLVGLAIAFRPAVAAPASDAATWSQTHPVMADRGTAVASTPATLDATTIWSQTHPVMVDRAGAAVPSIKTPVVNAYTGFDLSAAGSAASNKPLLDRGANR